MASDEIAQALKATDKPTVAVIREVGASGAYWIATACDVIIANRMSITGSIGATSSYLDFSGLINRYNVSYQRLVSGEFKDMGTPFRELTDEEVRIFNETLETIEEFFVEEISANRGMTVDEVRKYADGRFFLGIDALKYDLVDMNGGMKEAYEYTENILNITTSPVYYRTESSIFSEFFAMGKSKINYEYGLKV